MRAVAVMMAVWCLGGAATVRAQSGDERSDSNPTRPILFSLRPEFSHVAEDVWRMQVVVRYDRAAMRSRRWFGGKRGVLTRFELPVSAAAAGGSSTEYGLGDAYGQVLTVPKLSPRFAYVVGTGLSIPTATHALLGTGKWTIAPAFAPIWFLRGRGMTYVKVQNFSSFAGDGSRADLNFLLVTPTLIRTVGNSAWVLADTETKTDWERDGLTDVKSGLQVGWVVARGVGLWVKPEVWWGAHAGGRWNVKTGFVWYR
ncbi:MAG TPA: hypothetical protein VF147_13460 [Vicinamibacterales bacterium]